MLDTDISTVIDDPVYFYKYGFSDLIQPNEKDEPHPARKVEQNRWRIFCCQSIVDQLVERVLFQPVLEQIKRNYPHSGAVIGIGFSDDLVTQLCNYIKSVVNIKRLKGSDVASFEASLGRDWLKNSAEMSISKMSNRSKCSNVINAMRIHVLKITNPLYVVPFGTSYQLWRRLQPGGMLSGSFLTTLYNSLCRLDIAYEAGAINAFAVGDDCLEETTYKLEELRDIYSKLGFKLRELTDVKNFVIEFCSHEFYHVGNEQWKARLSSWPKALYNILSKNISMEQYQGFIHETRNNANQDKMLKTIDDYGTFNKSPNAI